MKRVISIVLISLIFFVGCKGENRDKDSDEKSIAVFSQAMTINEIVEVAEILNLSTDKAEDFIYVSEEYSKEVLGQEADFTGNPVAVNLTQFGENRGVKVEAIYQGDISFDEGDLSQRIKSLGLEDVGIRFYASERTSSDDIISCILKACDELAIEVDRKKF